MKAEQLSTPLLENILNQSAALHAVGALQLGPGRDSLERVAALLRSRKRIVITGMGASFFACIPFSYQLRFAGYSLLAVESSELLYFLESEVDENTAVLLVSRSGESIELTKLLDRFREKRATVIAVTNVTESTLATKADEAILIGSPFDQLIAIQTYTATVATLALLDAAMNNALDVAAAELASTASVLSGWIPECVAARETWVDFLDSPVPLYILGRGPALASVEEGVLLMHETAKSSAVGMTVAQFRHGPVEVVDERFRAVVIGTRSETVSLDATLAKDLAGLGGQVRWIGPETPGIATVPLCPWPSDIPERFTSIAEIVPLQLVAYKKAELAGIRLGEFRWSPAVTTTETGFLGRSSE